MVLLFYMHMIPGLLRGSMVYAWPIFRLHSRSYIRIFSKRSGEGELAFFTTMRTCLGAKGFIWNSDAQARRTAVEQASELPWWMWSTSCFVGNSFQGFVDNGQNECTQCTKVLKVHLQRLDCMAKVRV